MTLGVANAFLDRSPVLAITASLGVAYKIITNLVMLPLAASHFEFSRVYADRAMVKREQRARALAEAEEQPKLFAELK